MTRTLKTKKTRTPQAPTHRIEKRPEGFAVYLIAPRMVTQTLSSPESGLTQRVVPFGEVFKCPDPPLFHTCWQPQSKTWYTDIDYGAKRWRGPQSTSAIRQALRKCGFSPSVIKQTLVEAGWSTEQEPPKPKE